MIKKRIPAEWLFLLTLTVFSCRPNASHIDDVARISKQYADDIARIAKNYTDDAAKSANKVKPLSDDALKTIQIQPQKFVNWASRQIKRRYTQEQMTEVTNMVIKKAPPSNILGPDGSVLFTLPGESGTFAYLDGKVFKSTQHYNDLHQLFSQRHYDITRSILDHIDGFKVFPDEIDLVIQKSINATKGISQKATDVKYDPKTRNLVISYAMHQRTYNLGNLFFDGLGTAGISVGMEQYFTVKK